jgi:putative oxidoreductase
MEGWKALANLIGRILLVIIFVQSGVGKIGNFTGTVQMMASQGMPFAQFFLIGAIFFELIGSLAVILGYFTRFGALLLILFLIPTTLIFHNIWADPKMMIHFMKNVSMFGGLLVLLSSGGGRFSLDYFLRGE